MHCKTTPVTLLIFIKCMQMGVSGVIMAADFIAGLRLMIIYKMAREDPSRSRGWDESAVPSFGTSF